MSAHPGPYCSCADCGKPWIEDEIAALERRIGECQHVGLSYRRYRLERRWEQLAKELADKIASVGGED